MCFWPCYVRIIKFSLKSEPREEPQCQKLWQKMERVPSGKHWYVQKSWWVIAVMQYLLYSVTRYNVTFMNIATDLCFPHSIYLVALISLLMSTLYAAQIHLLSSFVSWFNILNHSSGNLQTVWIRLSPSLSANTCSTRHFLNSFSTQSGCFDNGSLQCHPALFWQ